MESSHHKRSNFSGSIGFVLAAAGSAVGLGNIWRFPYLAAKNGGGLFLLCYLVLALTFGFALLTTEIAIGRKTGQSPLTAYQKLDKKWGWLGVVACLVPAIILPYYCAIGGWVLKYLSIYVTGQGTSAVADGYFSGYISSLWPPILWSIVFVFITSYIVYQGVNQGIEKYSKILMPILLVLIIIIAVFSLGMKHTDAAGVTRTGLEGFAYYVIPNVQGLTLQRFVVTLTDAMGQLFFSISVAMGIMVTYGSYVKKETDLIQAVKQIEIFDTVVAFLAGMMIVPAIFTFMGPEGMDKGPGLMFVSLPKVFHAMGGMGGVMGLMFFIMVAFAALTSSVSIMEAIVSSMMDRFQHSRKKATVSIMLIVLVVDIVVCLGYNVLYFQVALPNSPPGTFAQILDVMDYLSNNLLMPTLALGTCVLVGWVIKPQAIIDEVTVAGHAFSRKTMYVVMVKYVAPVLLLVLLLQSLGIIRI